MFQLKNKWLHWKVQPNIQGTKNYGLTQTFQKISEAVINFIIKSDKYIVCERKVQTNLPQMQKF